MSEPTEFAAVAMQLAAGTWRPFPGYQGTKVPAMRGWPGLNKAEWDWADLAATVEEYQPREAFSCCLAVQRGIIAVDLDIEDPTHAAAAAGLADDVFGRTPLVRIGLTPKSVRVYRNGDGIKSQKLYPLEIFAGTGQIVAFGWHPKAGRPYQWPNGSPLDLYADSKQIPAVTRVQLGRFTNDLFGLVPRRPLHTPKDQPVGRGHRALTVCERLHILIMRYGSWRYAAQVVLSEATEGCRNETGWTVVASAAGRGIPEDVVWHLFKRYFCGWEGFSETQLMSAIERTRRVDARLRGQPERDRNKATVLRGGRSDAS
jgi:hypothetical protein